MVNNERVTELNNKLENHVAEGTKIDYLFIVGVFAILFAWTEFASNEMDALMAVLVGVFALGFKIFMIDLSDTETSKRKEIETEIHEEKLRIVKAKRDAKLQEEKEHQEAELLRKRKEEQLYLEICKEAGFEDSCHDSYKYPINDSGNTFVYFFKDNTNRFVILNNEAFTSLKLSDINRTEVRKDNQKGYGFIVRVSLNSVDLPFFYIHTDDDNLARDIRDIITAIKNTNA